MLLVRAQLALGPEHLECHGHLAAGVGRVDDVVDQSAGRRHVRGGEGLAVLLDQLGLAADRVVGLGDLLLEHDVRRTLGAHHRDLGGGPGEDLVRTEVLGAHRQVGTAVRLADHDGHLRDGRRGVGVEQLRAVADDAAVLLGDARQEAGDVDEGDQRDVEGVAEPDELRALVGGVDVQHAGHHTRLVRHDADGVPVDAGEADDDVLRVAGLDLEEVGVVDDAPDDLPDVVALLALGRYDVAQRLVRLDDIVGVDPRRLGEVVLRQEAEQLLRDQDGFRVVVGDEVVHAGPGHVRIGATQIVLAHLLAGHLGDHVRPGDEHVGLAGLDDEVGQRRGVRGTAGTGPGDDRDLRHRTGQPDVRVEHLAVAGQRVDALLDPGAARVVDEDEGRAGGERGLHHLDDLLGLRLAGRATHHGEVLGGDVHRAAEDGPRAGHHAVGRGLGGVHPEGGRTVRTEHPGLLERPGVEQGADPLTRGHLALLVLLVEAGLPATEFRIPTALGQHPETLGHVVRLACTAL
ncbi:hypothetical protein SDC9_84530 [bioreactor metagenome]|uniref:NAD-specific glutamate dehydrogenase n=1 Tax=bioreactor metagenome TaxID=1076179 RepID=A0A644ZAJ4_9ZZZZ